MNVDECESKASAGVPNLESGGFFLRRIGVLLALAPMLVATGCASLPDHPRAPSDAIARNANDPLSQLVSSSPAADSESIFRPLPFSRVSMDTRLALVGSAVHSLDLQYYLLQDDYTGRTLLRAVRDAALRGVRVRILVDDLYTETSEQLLLDLSATPNIEIRLFNPFPAGRLYGLTKWAYSLEDFARLNHRMHNKMLIADGAFVVAGGRNIADEYFFQSKTGNFIDFDLLIGGKVVPSLQKIFDSYWNSERVYPLLLLDRSTRAAAQGSAKFDMDTPPGGTFDEPVPQRADQLGYRPFRLDMRSPPLPMLAGDIEAFADDPEKVAGHAEAGDDPSTVTHRVLKALSEAKSDVVIASPYFIPGGGGLAALQQMRARGVHVTVITNALASNDEPLASAAYSRYRVRMLALGVDIYEVSSAQLRQNVDVKDLIGSSIGRSHAKIVVIDQKTTFVGSMNMDLRSSRENTELGMLVHSAPLAGDVIKVLSEIRASGSYHLRLAANGTDLEWVVTQDGAETVYRSEPELGAIAKFKLFMFSPFVPEGML